MFWIVFAAVLGTVSLVVATALAFAALTRESPRLVALCLGAAAVACAFNLAALGVRLADVGPADLLRRSTESNLLLAVLIAMTGMIARRTAAMRGLDGLLLAFAAIAQAGSLFRLNAPAQEAAYKPWFVSHPLALIVSAACFAAAAAAGAVYLLIYQLLRRKRGLGLLGRFPPLESLERFGRWALMIGFPCLTYGVLTGFCLLSRQSDPGPTAWLRDPFIIATLLLWCVYFVAVLIVWLRPRMRGPRAAALAAAGGVLVAVVFIIMDFVSTLHK